MKKGFVVQWAQLAYAISAAVAFVFVGLAFTDRDVPVVIVPLMVVMGGLLLWQMVNPPVRPRKTIAAGDYTVLMLRPCGDRVVFVTLQYAASGREHLRLYILPKYWFVTDPRLFTRSSGLKMQVVWDGRPFIRLTQPLAVVQGSGGDRTPA